MTDAQLTEILTNYIPQNAVKQILKWIRAESVFIKITPKRKTILGNYRSPHGTKGHQITVNGDLNHYAFLLTLIHEFAHLYVWKKHKNTVRPHGEEWAETFRELAHYFLQNQCFPKDLTIAIKHYLQNPDAASCRDENLYRMLRKYDKSANFYTELDDLPLDSLFRLEDGRLFRKGKKLRKYYRCEEQSKKIIYRINALTPVIPIES